MGTNTGYKWTCHKTFINHYQFYRMLLKYVQKDIFSRGESVFMDSYGRFERVICHSWVSTHFINKWLARSLFTFEFSI